MQTVQLIKDTVSELFQVMEIPVESIQVNSEDEGVKVDVTVDDKYAPLVIGVYGATLGALQVIVKSLLWKKGFEEKGNVQVDVNHYKSKQEERVILIAQEKAESVRATGIQQLMPPQTPYGRRLVHLYLAKEFPDLETESVGEEGHRRIQIRRRGGSDLES